MNTVISSDPPARNEFGRPSPAWRAVGASVRGSGHQKGGLCCQDAHAVRVIDGGWVALAVADGAGSAPRSEVGARAAAARAADVLAERVREFHTRGTFPADEAGWRAVVEDAIRAARDAVCRAADELGQPPRHLATTLLAVLVGPAVAAAAQVGDGGSVVLTGDGTPAALTLPPRGEYVNETTFLTSADALAEIQFGFRPGPVRAAAALTDGLQPFAFEYPAWDPHPAFFRRLFDYFEGQPDGEAARVTLEEFLAGGRVRGGTDDDVTLVVVTREPAPLGPGTEVAP